MGRELHERREQELDRLLRLIDAYISRRSKTHVPALMVWSSDSPHMQEEVSSHSLAAKLSIYSADLVNTIN